MARMVSPTTAERPFDAFVCYRESAQRRAALAAAMDAPERYLLFGLDELTARGVRARHNLERPPGAPAWARVADSGLNRFVRRGGGYGGDFYSVLPSLRPLNAADVVFST